MHPLELMKFKITFFTSDSLSLSKWPSCFPLSINCQHNSSICSCPKPYQSIPSNLVSPFLYNGIEVNLLNYRSICLFLIWPRVLSLIVFQGVLFLVGLWTKLSRLGLRTWHFFYLHAVFLIVYILQSCHAVKHCIIFYLFFVIISLCQVRWFFLVWPNCQISI